MKALITIILMCGLLTTVSGVCNRIAADQCLGTLKSNLQQAGDNKTKLCAAFNIFFQCLKTTGCENDPSVKAQVAKYEKILDQHGCMISGAKSTTVSVLAVLTALVAILLQ